MRFGMSVNMNIPDAPRMAKRTLDLLKGHEVLLEKEMAERFKTKGLRLEEMEVDMMVTVGGDGTILRALQHNKAPILGINAGDLGFLTVASEEELEEAIDNVLHGNYELEERIKLQTTVGGKRMLDAMNEAVLHTAHVAKIRHFQVFVDGEMAMKREGGRDRCGHPHRLDLLRHEPGRPADRSAGGSSRHRANGPVQVLRPPGGGPGQQPYHRAGRTPQGVRCGRGRPAGTAHGR